MRRPGAGTAEPESMGAAGRDVAPAVTELIVLTAVDGLFTPVGAPLSSLAPTGVFRVLIGFARRRLFRREARLTAPNLA